MQWVQWGCLVGGPISLRVCHTIFGTGTSHGSISQCEFRYGDSVCGYQPVRCLCVGLPGGDPSSVFHGVRIPPMLLSTRYAMSATGIRYLHTCLRARYAMSSTRPTASIRCAMSGTELRYAATRFATVHLSRRRVLRNLNKMKRDGRSLRAQYAVSGTGLAYAARRCPVLRERMELRVCDASVPA
eukprot:1655440-Rhodomonas_salina.1